MAITYGFSSNDTIKHLVEYLKHSLDDSFEIFIEPKINTDVLHIVILRMNGGVYLLQVKSTNFENFYVDDYWIEKTSLKRYQSPIIQMQNYKNNFFMYHVPKLYEKLVVNDQYFGIVRTGIYFEKSTTTQATSILKKDKNYSRYVDIFGYNCIDRGQIVNVLLKRLVNSNCNYLFTEEIYENIKSTLLNKKFCNNYLMPIKNTKFKKIIESTNARLKVKSNAGEILYQTLIQKIIKTNKRVLVLTYSITLQSYLMSLLPTEYHHRVVILHIHQFITAQLNNINSIYSLEDKASWMDLKDNRRYLPTFDTIVFSEVDKYPFNWQREVKDIFTSAEANLYIFQHAANNEKVKTIVPGKWKEIENTNVNRKIEFIIKDNHLIDVIDIQHFLKNNNSTWEDTVILSSQKSYLRFINEQLKNKLSIQADISFATTEEYELLKKKFNDHFGLEIQKLERNKKFYFGRDFHKLQLNTVKSHVCFYKPTLICLLTDKDKKDLYYDIIINIDEFPTNIFFILLGRQDWQEYIDYYV